LKKFAEILVNQNKIYTYSVPQEMQKKILVGQKVVVPLRKKETEGFVVRFVAEPDFKCVAVKKIEDDKQYFDETLADISQWMAGYYKCFDATAMKAILPK